MALVPVASGPSAILKGGLKKVMDGSFDEPRTVTIPIRFGPNGEVNFFYGGNLPAMKENTIGELIVPAHAVLDERKLALLEHEQIESVIPKGARVTALVIVRLAHLNAMPEDRRKYLLPKAPDIHIADSHFIEIHLETGLEIRLRGTKLAELLPCECTVPALPNKRLRSLNQAFSAISEVYQQHRSTHVGNVFSRIYMQTGEDAWSSLGDLRSQLFGAVIEQRLLAMCRPWWYRTDSTTKHITWALVSPPENGLATVYLMDERSMILSQQYFADEDQAKGSLKAEGFTEFDSMQSPKRLVQPEPPYTMPNGEEKRLALKVVTQPTNR